MKTKLFSFLLLFFCVSCVEKIINVDSIELDRTELTLVVGESVGIDAMIYPSDADNKDLVWISKNTEIATVEDGVVTANGPGTTKITVKSVDAGKTASCVVTVNEVFVVLSEEVLKIVKDEDMDLAAEILPENDLYTEVHWSSGNEEIVAVDSKGKVTALAYGHAFVYARVAEYEAGCAVVVVADADDAIDYIDEYGINHGKGINIGEYVWAPVNCGYKAPVIGDDGEVVDKGYPYGKLYQWGRKYGQGLGPEYDNYMVQTGVGPVDDAVGQAVENQDVFYVVSDEDNDWSLTASTHYLNDPCPEGWRVPSSLEMHALFLNHSTWEEDENGMSGYYFSGCYTYYDYVPKMFLPASGYRSGIDAHLWETDNYGYYWTSTVSSPEAVPYFRSFMQGMVFSSDYTYHRSFGYSIRCIQQ